VQLLSEDMNAENTTAIERVKAKLADLRRLDSAFTLFGASTHHYQLGRSLTVSDLAAYERRLGCRSLPSIETLLWKWATEARVRSTVCLL